MTDRNKIPAFSKLPWMLVSSYLGAVLLVLLHDLLISMTLCLFLCSMLCNTVLKPPESSFVAE
jgi:hypothetical protein